MPPPPGRNCPKHVSRTSVFQQKRREEALQRQKKGRESKLLILRLQAAATFQEKEQGEPIEEDSNGNTADTLTEQFKRGLTLGEPSRRNDAENGDESLRQSCLRQFMHPEWMTDTPPDMLDNWVVMPRPEGVRCMVTTMGTFTISRRRNGSVLHRFHCSLPGGSLATKASPDQFSVFDCVFQAKKNVYYVMDIMCWKGMPLCDCAAEFRLYWVREKLKESGVLDRKNQKYRFDLVSSHPCTSQGLAAAVQGPVPFVRDGILLAHKEGHYVAGITPLMLLWKDASCSTYFLDTDGSGQLPQYQMVTLTFDGDRHVETEDFPPVRLGSLCDDAIAAHSQALKKGRLVKFTIQEQGIRIVDGEPQSADLHFQGLANQRKGRADSISKILFQYYARAGRISFDLLLQSVGASVDHAPVEVMES
ncbi:hypothetical protein BSKO_00580 [Bryopsis sp. KO-2023]|nr:hypothetical protein BSKO_00580 [Bryopsis sp. KO-2023]